MARVTLNFKGGGRQEYEVSHDEALRIKKVWESTYDGGHIEVYENRSKHTSHPRGDIRSITFEGRGL